MDEDHGDRGIRPIANAAISKARRALHICSIHHLWMRAASELSLPFGIIRLPGCYRLNVLWGRRCQKPVVDYELAKIRIGSLSDRNDCCRACFRGWVRIQDDLRTLAVRHSLSEQNGRKPIDFGQLTWINARPALSASVFSERIYGGEAYVRFASSCGNVPADIRRSKTMVAELESGAIERRGIAMLCRERGRADGPGIGCVCC